MGDITLCATKQKFKIFFAFIFGNAWVSQIYITFFLRCHIIVCWFNIYTVGYHCDDLFQMILVIFHRKITFHIHD